MTEPNHRRWRALVTGGAVRLGRAAVEELAAVGCAVVVHAHGSTNAAEALVGDLRARGHEAHALGADLTDRRAVDRLVVDAAELLGGLDVLVNNAALFLPGGLAGSSDSMWDLQFALNLEAPFRLARSFAGLPRADGEVGRIVNVVDARVFRPGTDHLIYRLTKVALAELTRCLALELAPRITVNGIAPGAMLPAAGDSAERFDALVRDRVPLRRPGGAAPFRRALRFILEEPFLTGEIVRIDGGQFL